MIYSFYSAFFEPDTEKRRAAIESWINETVPVIQSSVEDELQFFLESVLKDTWTLEGWKSRVEKFNSPFNAKQLFIDKYRLYLDTRLRTHSSSDKDVIVGALTPEIRAKTLKAAEAAKSAVAKLEPPPPVTLREIDLHGSTVDEAIPVIEKFLKECYRDNVRRVRIFHGKGIFILQKAIRAYLGKSELIKPGSISPADKDHGGEGATEAILVYFSVDKLN
jgi:DNA-nicking Smr family endonuclease